MSRLPIIFFIGRTIEEIGKWLRPRGNERNEENEENERTETPPPTTPTNDTVNEEKRGLYVGIDLGNTYSSIGYYDENNVSNYCVLLKHQDDSEIPTFISINEFDGEIELEIGKKAKTSKNLNSRISYFKKALGKKYNEALIDSEIIINLIRGKKFSPQFSANFSQMNDCFEPEEITAMFLFNLMKLLPKGKDIEQICVTHPVDFKEKEKSALLRAFYILNVPKERIVLIHEPTASILAYQKEHPDEMQIGNKFVVVDFGGGTLDIACCLIEKNKHYPGDNSKNKIRVIGNDGYGNLGGKQFDDVLGNIVKRKINLKLRENYKEEIDFKTYFNKNENTSEEEILKRKYRFEILLEEYKISLSYNEKITIQPHDFVKDIPRDDNYKFRITREEFEEEIKKSGLLERMIRIIEQTMTKKEVKWEKKNVTNVLFIGGTCDIPIVRNTLEDYFGKKEKMFSEKQFESKKAVVKGATIYAFQSINKTSNIKDTLPYSLYAQINDRKKYIQFFEEGTKLPSVSKPITIERREGEDNKIIFVSLFRKDSKSEKYILFDDLTFSTKNDFYSIDFILTVDVNGNIKISLINEENNEKLSITTNSTSLRNYQTNRMINHLSKYINFEENIFGITPEVDNFHEIKRNYNPNHHSMGIHFENEKTRVFFRNVQSKSLEILQLNGQETIDNYISINKIEDSLELGKDFTHPLNLNRIGQYIMSQEFRMSNEMIYGTDEFMNSLFSFYDITKKFYFWDLFTTYFDTINNFYKSRNVLPIGNVVMAIPHSIDDKTFEYLKMGMNKCQIDHIEFIRETYAAMIWFNHEHKGLLQNEKCVKIINFNLNHSEIDTLKIKDKENDIIIKTKRSEPSINKSINMNKIDEIIMNYVLQTIRENDCLFMKEYIDIENEDKKQKAINIIMNKTMKMKRSMFIDNENNYPFKYHEENEEFLDLFISKEEILKEIKNQMKESIKQFINSNQMVVDHVIVIIDEVNQSIIEPILQEIIVDKEIYYMTPEDIGRGACQRAIEIHDFGENNYNEISNDETRYDIEFDIDEDF